MKKSLNKRIDKVEKSLNNKIDNVERVLTFKIDNSNNELDGKIMDLAAGVYEANTKFEEKFMKELNETNEKLDILSKELNELKVKTENGFTSVRQSNTYSNKQCCNLHRTE